MLNQESDLDLNCFQNSVSPDLDLYCFQNSVSPHAVLKQYRSRSESTLFSTLLEIHGSNGNYILLIECKLKDSVENKISSQMKTTRIALQAILSVYLSHHYVPS